MDWEIDDGESTTAISLHRQGDGWSGRIGKRARRIDLIASSPSSLTCCLGNHHVVQAEVRWDGTTCHLVIDHVPFHFVVSRRSPVASTRSSKPPTTSFQPCSGEVRAPMPARVVDVRVKPGERVTKGVPVIVLEAMKMQNELPAPTTGIIRAVHVTTGQAVEGNQILVTFAAE